MSPRNKGPQYRKISTQMWGDEKFRRLSAPKPNAQSLWQWLLTGPKSTVIPGLLHHAGAGAIAEDLGWSLRSTRECISEIETIGKMAIFDLKMGVVWIPKAIVHNPPQSPNTTRQWASTLYRDFPECDLVRTAVAEIRTYLSKKDKDYADAFENKLREVLGDRSWNGLAYLPPTQRSESSKQRAVSRKEEMTTTAEPLVASTAETPKGPPRQSGLELKLESPPAPKKKEPFTPHPSGLVFPCTGRTTEWRYSVELHDKMAEQFPDVDVLAVVKMAHAQMSTAKTKRQPFFRMEEALWHWLENERRKNNSQRFSGPTQPVRPANLTAGERQIASARRLVEEAQEAERLRLTDGEKI